MAVKVTRTIVHGEYRGVQVSEGETVLLAVAGLPGSAYDSRTLTDIVAALVMGENEWGWVTYAVENVEFRAALREARAALREAIAKHGNEGVLWVLDAPVREFDEAWADEMDALVNTGECEIRSWYTTSGNPVVVRVGV